MILIIFAITTTSAIIPLIIIIITGVFITSRPTRLDFVNIDYKF
jgi:hypothetical protein